jgi:methylation protein EvaC
MPIANGFLTLEGFDDEYFFELAPAFCEKCGMFQITQQPDPARMFHENYAFFSQTSRVMRAHFEEFAKQVMERDLKCKDPFVVEIGSNDGIMLKHFAASRIRHLGIDPSANVAAAARAAGVNTLCAFFSKETAISVREENGPADVILAANVMCHIPDLHSVAAGVEHLLKPDGLFIFEDPYLGNVIEKTSYDQIYDEHVYLFSVRSVTKAFDRHGIEVIHIEPQATHGGSMRYVLAYMGHHTISDSVHRQIALEDRMGLDRPETYLKFRQKCEASRDRLVEVLHKMKAESKRVVGYGATSKSTTVTNYCEITPELVEYISDTTPTKQGKFSPGVHIPVRPYEDFCMNYPDIALLFAWNHSEEIMAKEEYFKKSGGSWLVYVPNVEVL